MRRTTVIRASSRVGRRMLARYAIDPVQVQRAPGGVENETFYVDAADGQYVLRVYRHYKKTLADMYRELDFMDFLSEQGVAVPRVIANARGRVLTQVTVDGVAWQGIVMNRMLGEHPTRYSPQLLGEMARLQARLHLLGQEYAQVSLRHMSVLERFTAGPLGRLRLDLSMLVRAVPKRLLPRGFCHYDFTPDNLLVQDQRISAVLDFDDMAYGPLASCLAITLSRLPEALRTPENSARYVAEYETVRPLGAFERFYLWRVLGLKRLARRVLRFAV